MLSSVTENLFYNWNVIWLTQDAILYLQHILSVITMLENSGFEKLVTFCHGDAKPNNFLFRNIEVDIEGNGFYFKKPIGILDTNNL